MRSSKTLKLSLAAMLLIVPAFTKTYLDVVQDYKVCEDLCITKPIEDFITCDDICVQEKEAGMKAIDDQQKSKGRYSLQQFPSQMKDLTFGDLEATNIFEVDRLVTDMNGLQRSYDQALENCNGDFECFKRTQVTAAGYMDAAQDQFHAMQRQLNDMQVPNYVPFGNMQDDANFIIQETNNAYEKYAQCFAFCESKQADADCYYQCNSYLTLDMQSVTSLFRTDNRYSFDLSEDLYFNEKSIIEVNQAVDDQVKHAYREMRMNEMLSTVKLFALEKYSKALFDPLYIADIDPFVQYEQCKAQCGKTDYECFAFCNEQLQRRLDNEVKNSLAPVHQDIFNNEMTSIVEYQKCILKAGDNSRLVNRCIQEYTQLKVASPFSLAVKPSEEAIQKAVDDLFTCFFQALDDIEAQAVCQEQYINALEHIGLQSLANVDQITLQLQAEREISECYFSASTQLEFIGCIKLAKLFNEKYYDEAWSKFGTIRDYHSPTVDHANRVKDIFDFDDCSRIANSVEDFDECIQILNNLQIESFTSLYGIPSIYDDKMFKDVVIEISEPVLLQADTPKERAAKLAIIHGAADRLHSLVFQKLPTQTKVVLKAHKSLMSIELNESEKLKVNQFLNKAQTITDQARTQLPSAKQAIINELLQTLQIVEFELSTMQQNYDQIRELLGINSLMTYFKEQSADPNSHLLTLEQVMNFSEFELQMQDVAEIFQCQIESDAGQRDANECLALAEAFQKKWESTTIMSLALTQDQIDSVELYRGIFGNQVGDQYSLYFECLNDVKTMEDLNECEVYSDKVIELLNGLNSLFSITLTDLEKQQVNQYLNQAQQVTAQAQAQFPVVKQTAMSKAQEVLQIAEAELATMKQYNDQIRKLLGVKSLMAYFKEQSADPNSNLLTLEQVISLSDLELQLQDLDELLQCQDEYGAGLRDINECFTLLENFQKKWQTGPLSLALTEDQQNGVDMFRTYIGEDIAIAWTNYYECANKAEASTDISIDPKECDIYLDQINAILSKLTSLFAITLTDLEKKQVDMYLNQVEQVTVQAQAQFPAAKQVVIQEIQQSIQVVEAELATMRYNYEEIRKLLSVKSLMSYFKEQSEDQNSQLLTLQQLVDFDDFDAMMREFDEILQCNIDADMYLRDATECLDLIEAFNQKWSANSAASLFLTPQQKIDVKDMRKYSGKQAASYYSQYLECYNEALKLQEDAVAYFYALLECNVYIDQMSAAASGASQLFSITLTDLEKQQVDQYLNQASKATTEVQVQLPAMKQVMINEVQQIIQVVEAELSTMEYNYREIRKLLGVQSLMSYFQEQSNDVNSDLATVEQLMNFEDFNQQMNDINEISLCNMEVFTENRDISECIALEEAYVQKWESNNLISFYLTSEQKFAVEMVRDQAGVKAAVIYSNYFECVNDAKSMRDWQTCNAILEQYQDFIMGVSRLFSITLTDLEKQQVNQYLNQAQQVKNQVRAQLPGVKAAAQQRFEQITQILDQRLQTVDQEFVQLKKALSIQSLQQFDNSEEVPTYAELIEEEFLRNEALLRDNLRKNLNVFREVVVQEFNLTNEQEWFIQAAGQAVKQAECSAQCVEECFNNGNGLSIQDVVLQCVIPKCQCQEQYLPADATVSLQNINIDFMPFNDYLIKEQNSRLIEESLRQSEYAAQVAQDEFESINDFNELTLELTRERMECGADCLSTQDVPFLVKDTCMKAACGINVNLFFRDELKTCDLQCANRCMALVFEQAQQNCVEKCGCNTNSRFPVLGAINLASQVDSTSTPKNLYVNIVISLIVAAFIGGVVVTLRRAKRQSYKGQMVKPSELKKERKAKILNNDEEQNSFVIEEKYERVI